MKRKLIIPVLAALFAVTAFTGCASVQQTPYAKMEPAKNEALVYFYRESNFIKSALVFEVYLDKEKLGELYNGSHFPARIEPGQHDIHIKRMAALMEEWRGNISMNLEPGKTYYVKYGPDHAVGGWKLRTVPADKAMKEIKDLPWYQKQEKD